MTDLIRGQTGSAYENAKTPDETCVIGVKVLFQAQFQIYACA